MAALTELEIGVVARAVSRAPSVHDAQPWRLAVRGRSVDLLECDKRVLPVRDPAGRDRLISCGAALADLELAVRSLGWEADVELPGSGPLVATVTAGAERAATPIELALYRAICRRRTYRRRFAPGLADDGDRAAVAAAASGQGVTATEAVPAGRPIARFGAEHLLVLSTEADSRRELVRTGRALQRAWLAATAQGLAGSAITQPRRLSLPEWQELPGRPQAALRFGYPAMAVPPSPRLPLGELIDHEPTGGTR